MKVPASANAVDLTARAGVINTGAAAVNVTAQISSKSASVVVLDGQVGFGTVNRTPLLKPVMSLDTFKLRLLLPRPLSVSSLLQFAQTVVDALSWEVGCSNCGHNRPPIANAGADQTAYIAQPITLDGSASSDPDGNPLLFRWSVLSKPSNSGAQPSPANAVKPTFVPDRDGIYVFQLVVNDGIADSTPASVTVTTRNSAPVAHAGPDRTAVVGALVLLDAAGSTDIDGDPLTYEWSLLSRPADSAARLLNADPASPLAEFILDKPGQYVVELVVNDGLADSEPDTAAVSTVNSAPVADAGPDQTAEVGATVQLSGSASSDVDGDLLTYRWSLTAPAGSQASLTVAAGVATSFVVDKPGTYIAQLIVSDRSADSTADTAVISTINSAPVADAGTDRTVAAGEEVMLDGSRSSDADGDALGFSWSLTSKPPDSQAELSDPNATQPSMTTDRAGPYIGQLVVNDGSVNSAPATVTITARDVPPPPEPDIQPPAAPDASRISVTAEDTDRLTLSGAAGSVGHGVQVIVSNFTTGAIAMTTAGPDGAFMLSIAAMEGDSLLVTARDAAGNTSLSTAVSTDGGMELTIDEPSANRSLSGSVVLVAGGLRAPPNTGVTVNGRTATVYYDTQGSTYETQIELVPDPEAGELALPVPIEVVASAPDGRSVAQTVTVLVRSFSRYTLQASPGDGPAPLQVGFEIVDNNGQGITGISMDFDGDGTPDLTTTNPEEPLHWTYTEPGTYLATAKVTTGFGTVQTASVPVRVQEQSGFSDGLRGIWDAMNAALANGNLIAAKARLTESAKRQYGPVFEELVDQMPQIVESFSPLQMTEAGGNVAEFALAREVEGILRGFFVYMVRCPDGVWRVAGM